MIEFPFSMWEKVQITPRAKNESHIPYDFGDRKTPPSCLSDELRMPDIHLRKEGKCRFQDVRPSKFKIIAPCLRRPYLSPLGTLDIMHNWYSYLRSRNATGRMNFFLVIILVVSITDGICPERCFKWCNLARSWRTWHILAPSWSVSNLTSLFWKLFVANFVCPGFRFWNAIWSEMRKSAAENEQIEQLHDTLISWARIIHLIWREDWCLGKMYFKLL
jgi:hypothetical protein